MAFDGSGTFSLIYNWATEAASPPIAISKLDTEMAGIATGLSSCMLRTGGTVTGATTFNAAVTISAAIPYLLLSETGVTADNGKWGLLANSEEFSIRAYDDALSGVAQAMLITRTGTTVDAITFAGTQINLNCTGTAVNGDLAISGALTVGSQAIALAPASGNFTMELATASSGGSVLGSGTAYWKRVGGVVTMRLPYLVATTTDTSIYLRGIPAACQPSLTGDYTQCVLVAGKINGADGAVQIDVYEGQAYWLLEGITAAFAGGSDAKGVGVTSSFGPVITYQVTD